MICTCHSVTQSCFPANHNIILSNYELVLEDEVAETVEFEPLPDPPLLLPPPSSPPSAPSPPLDWLPWPPELFCFPPPSSDPANWPTRLPDPPPLWPPWFCFPPPRKEPASWPTRLLDPPPPLPLSSLLRLDLFPWPQRMEQLPLRFPVQHMLPPQQRRLPPLTCMQPARTAAPACHAQLQLQEQLVSYPHLQPGAWQR